MAAQNLLKKPSNASSSGLRGKYGTPEMREIAGRVKYLLIAGDIVDGVGIYPGQQNELTIRDVHKQYNFAIKYLEKIPDYIEIVLSPGNHDAARKSLAATSHTRRILDCNSRAKKTFTPSAAHAC